MNVLLVDDHHLLLEGLQNLLAAHGVQVVGLAHDGLEAVELARATRPDVILMDIRMPRGDGLEATRRICAEWPAARIVILTTSTEDADLFEAVKSGACGYLLKSMNADELIECLHGAQEGVPPFSPGLAAKVLGEYARLAGQRPAPVGEAEAELTPRQREVLALVAEGLTYKEVGARLNLSPRTIKYHMAAIMAQLHLEHRAQVLAYAGRLGLDS
ncbi:MAG TPA: response regulator transcription factor [Promineifilum sp.]|nr:response regulator transcription factor [Promineifilum sp.]